MLGESKANVNLLYNSVSPGRDTFSGVYHGKFSGLKLKTRCHYLAILSLQSPGRSKSLATERCDVPRANSTIPP